MKKNQTYYKELFAGYPDIVNVSTFRKMLGGVGGNSAYKIIRENKIPHITLGNSYMIPKVCIINYVMSKENAARRLNVNV